MTKDYFVKIFFKFIQVEGEFLYWLIRNWKKIFHKSCLIWKDEIR
jgi:hypothetical protein